MNWWDVKVWLSTTTGLHMDALHVHAGILLQLAAALLLRKSLASPWPWAVVLLAAGLNEYYDWAFETWPNDADQRAEGLRDLWNTLLLPTLLLIGTRFLPRLFVAGRSAADSGEPGAERGKPGGEA